MHPLQGPLTRQRPGSASSQSSTASSAHAHGYAYSPFGAHPSGIVMTQQGPATLRRNGARVAAPGSLSRASWFVSGGTVVRPIENVYHTTGPSSSSSFSRRRKKLVFLPGGRQGSQHGGSQSPASPTYSSPSYSSASRIRPVSMEIDPAVLAKHEARMADPHHHHPPRSPNGPRSTSHPHPHPSGNAPLTTTKAPNGRVAAVSTRADGEEAGVGTEAPQQSPVQPPPAIVVEDTLY